MDYKFERLHRIRKTNLIYTFKNVVCSTKYHGNYRIYEARQHCNLFNFSIFVSFLFYSSVFAVLALPSLSPPILLAIVLIIIKKIKWSLKTIHRTVNWITNPTKETFTESLHDGSYHKNIWSWSILLHSRCTIDRPSKYMTTSMLWFRSVADILRCQINEDGTNASPHWSQVLD